MSRRDRKQTRLLGFIGSHRVDNKRNLHWEQINDMFRTREATIIAVAVLLLENLYNCFLNRR